MTDAIRICLVEDNANYAESIREVITSSEGMEFLSQYGSAGECQEAFQASPPAADIILLDYRLPDRNGLTLMPLFQEKAPDAGVIVLTGNDDYRTVLEAIQLGVLGYILKDAPIADLRRAIEEVNKGGCVIDPQLSRFVLKALSVEDGEVEAASKTKLSRREHQVLKLMALGHTKREVAKQLGISYSAIALYSTNIYQKLQVPNIAAAVATAIRKGLI